MKFPQAIKQLSVTTIILLLVSCGDNNNETQTQNFKEDGIADSIVPQIQDSNTILQQSEIPAKTWADSIKENDSAMLLKQRLAADSAVKIITDDAKTEMKNALDYMQKKQHRQ